MTNSPLFNRRRAFRWPSTAAVAVVAVVTLAGCGGGGDTAATSSVASSSTAASGTSSSVPSDSTTSGSTTTATAASGTLSTAEVTAGSGDVVALAEAFAATLTDEQKTALNQEYTFANATSWSNLPASLGGGGGGGGTAPGGMTGTPPGGSGDMTGTPPTDMGGGGGGVTRVGLQTSTLTDEQWTALQALLAAATGSTPDEGYDEVIQQLLADDYLGENGGGDSYSQGQFFIAFLGTPSATGTWELQFGGHHLALANTYTDGALAGATPSFRGIEPLGTVEVDGVTVDPQEQERAAFAALLGSLDETQAAAAKLSETFGDILLGPGSDWAFPTTAEGLSVSELSDEQKALVLAAIKTYVDDIDDANAATILAKYESELDQTTISYTGTTDVTQTGDYIRIDGPSVWIEFSMQNGVVLDGAHPHAVWRDKQTDYAGLTA